MSDFCSIYGNNPVIMEESNRYIQMNGSMEDCEDSPPVKITNINSKYQLVYENGHRRFGPPSEWEGEAPQRGCEVFVGKLPRDCNEDELIPIFESCGKIYEFRLMVDFNGINRGYAFCVYQNKDDANKCVEKLNNYEIRPGKNIGVCFSVDNCRLFVGGIPKNKSKEEIFQEMQRVTSGVVDVIAYPSIANKNKNRGFAFVEYESHKAAAVARRKLIPGKIPLWGQQIAVDWAEPEREVHESIMANVKILYARNLMLTTTEETLRDKFLIASGGPSTCIERVKKMKDYAFIHFTERHFAEKARNSLNYSEIDGSIIEVSWAKPADKSQSKPNKLSAASGLGGVAGLGGLNCASFNPAATAGGLLLSSAGGGADPLNMDLHAGAATQLYVDSNTGLHFLGPALPPGTWGANPLGLLMGDSINRNRQCRRNAAGTRNLNSNNNIINNKKQSIELLEELALMYNWGMPHYTVTPHESERNGVKLNVYSAQVYLPNLRHSQNSPGLYNIPDDAKCAVAELFIRCYTQQANLAALAAATTNPLGGIDFRHQLGTYQALSLAALANVSASAAIPQPTNSSTNVSTASLLDAQTGLGSNTGTGSNLPPLFYLQANNPNNNTTTLNTPAQPPASLPTHHHNHPTQQNLFAAAAAGTANPSPNSALNLAAAAAAFNNLYPTTLNFTSAPYTNNNTSSITAASNNTNNPLSQFFATSQSLPLYSLPQQQQMDAQHHANNGVGAGGTVVSNHNNDAMIEQQLMRNVITQLAAGGVDTSGAGGGGYLGYATQNPVAMQTQIDTNNSAHQL